MAAVGNTDKMDNKTFFQSKILYRAEREIKGRHG